MHKEIERKFLVNSDDYKDQAQCQYNIIQGFLNKDKNRTVRIRIKDNKGFITVKGISSENGLSRLEWEKEIKQDDAKDLLQLCEKPLLVKTRFEILFKGKLYEVDEFHENHQGLVIAEIELKKESESFEKPDWLGKEVTGNKAYYNSQL
jgi:CYTH domain-containing protein